MAALSPLVDRDQERTELQQLAREPGPHLAILYGRRQVGKTYLLGRTWPDARVFYFLAADTPAELNRRDLLRELAAWSKRDLNPDDYPTWRTVFRIFVEMAVEAPLVVILDEFQYLLGGPDDAASQLVAVWDREAAGRPLTLVLCGSEVSAMEHLLAGGQPLYGRASWSARLHVFDYRDAARMLPWCSAREAALYYGIFGGTPRYLVAARPDATLTDNVVRTVLSPRGEIHLQLLSLIEQEKGIRTPREFRAVLAAIAAGRSELNDIAQEAALGGQPHVVRRILQILEDLEIVGRERNFAASAKAPYRYYLVDNAVAFWHRFVVPNRSRLSTGDAGEVWNNVVEPYLNDWMGNVFERMVAQAYTRFHRRWGVSGARSWASWVGQDRNGRDIQVDVVSRLDDGTMLTGEIKWSSQPRGFELHNDLTRDLDDLGRSGQAWAREAQRGHFLYVSAAGFSERFRDWAATQADVVLVTLDDLFVD